MAEIVKRTARAHPRIHSRYTADTCALEEDRGGSRRARINGVTRARRSDSSGEHKERRDDEVAIGF